jgi:xylulokinase
VAAGLWDLANLKREVAGVTEPELGWIPVYRGLYPVYRETYYRLKELYPRLGGLYA